ncbi:MAG: YwbE family protein [Euryarchaeota archaeon]|nr:YwbE family protein [Euryarchaeota archaeon]
MSNGNIRNNIKIGSSVGIVLKKDQKTGAITRGIVTKILTKSSSHPHGIKVQLEDGQVGRVKEISL